MRIRREDLPTYEAMGKFITQRKFNGTHVVIWVYKDEVMLWDRRGTPLTLYTLTAAQKRNLLSLERDPEKELILCGELLHTKAKSKISNEQAATDTIVLFDVIYYGDHLTQMTQVERLDFLAAICRNPTDKEAGTFRGATKRAFVVRDDGDAHLWLAEVFTKEFDYHFDECFDEDSKGRDKYPEIEGLMLRLAGSKLRSGGSGDVDWLIRCRKFKDGIYNF
jgi:hypothetical protein